jgi:PIN like domain
VSRKSAVVRFYIDADLLGLAKHLVLLRSDVTYPGDPGGELHRRVRPPCPVARANMVDSEWIPIVAKHGWMAITRDGAIQQNAAEIAAVRTYGLRMIALGGTEARTPWEQLEILLCQWRAIEATFEQDGSFIYTATRTTLRGIPLDGT